MWMFSASCYIDYYMFRTSYTKSLSEEEVGKEKEFSVGVMVAVMWNNAVMSS